MMCQKFSFAHKSRIIGFIFIAVLLLAAFPAFAQNARPRLGLSVSPLQASPVLLQHLRLAEGEGLMVDNIAVGGELEAAGLSQGDIVLAVDGKPLSKPQQLNQYLSTKPNGSQITLDVIQKGEHRQIYVKLDNLPDEITWKYSRPVAGPGRSSLGSRQSSPNSFQFNIQPSSPNAGSNQAAQGAVSSKSIYKNIIVTPDGLVSSTVSISGPHDDPASQIEIQIGEDSWKTTIQDIDKLPDAAKNAAQSALSQSQNFSFSWGAGNDLFDELFQRHQEQIQRMNDMFNQQYMQPLPNNGNIIAPPDNDDNNIQS